MTAPDRIWCQNNTSGHMDDLLELAVRPHAEVINTAFTEYVRADLVAELIALIRDAIEEEDEFETEWNKSARAAIARYRGGV